MTGGCTTNICFLNQEKKTEYLLHASTNLHQAHLIFFHIKKVKFDDIVALLTFITIFTQQQPNGGNEEEFEKIFLQTFFFLS